MNFFFAARPLLLRLSLVFVFFCSSNTALTWAATPGKLRVSSNGRFLVNPDGTPFVWIGDTMWCACTDVISAFGCAAALTDAQQTSYLNARKAQGFNVIQTNIGSGGSQVITQDPAYWLKVDSWLQKIAASGLYAAVGLGWIMPYWDLHDFTEQQLYQYGQFVGNRYRAMDNLVWIGPNEATWKDASMTKLNQLIQGLKDGDTGDKLMTVHPMFGGASSYFFSTLDFNAWQTGRYQDPTQLPYYRLGSDVPGDYTVWEAIAHDYTATPAKPVIDLEAWYEGGLDYQTNKIISTAGNVRRRAYFTILAGAFGHTYGAWDVWRAASNWQTALQLPGADDMRHIRTLLESTSRPLLKLVPNQNLIVLGQSTAYLSHKQSAMASDGAYAYIYTGNGSGFSVKLDLLGAPGDLLNALWFNPRDATTSTQNLNPSYARVNSQAFTPPNSPGENNDWILILEKIAAPIAPAAPAGLTAN